MEADVVLILLLGGGFLLGFFRGFLRAAAVLGAWVFCFVLASHVRVPVGEWIYRLDDQLSPGYAIMLGFAATFAILFTVAALVIVLIPGPTQLTRHAILDDMLGGVLGVGATLLLVAALIVILDSIYVVEPPAPGRDLPLLTGLHDLLGDSTVAQGVRATIVPALGFLLGALLPADVRAVMA